MKIKTVFFGSSEFVIPIIDILREISDLGLVITTEKASTDTIPSYCQKHSIPCVTIFSFSDEIISKIKDFNPDLGVLANFRLTIPGKIFDIFPNGILNIHPSLLPKYRGPTPVQTAILNEEKITGVSLIRLDDKIDHGPVIEIAEEKISENDTSQTLYKKLFKKGAELLKKNLEKYIQGKIKLEEQNDKDAIYTKLLTKNSGFIDLNKNLSKNEINKIIKAYYPWPGVWTRVALGGKEKIIKILPNEKIQVEGKKEMSYKDFINGYKEGKDILEKIL